MDFGCGEFVEHCRELIIKVTDNLRVHGLGKEVSHLHISHLPSLPPLLISVSYLGFVQECLRFEIRNKALGGELQFIQEAGICQDVTQLFAADVGDDFSLSVNDGHSCDPLQKS